MKYLLLVLLLAGCAHTKYTEVKTVPLFLFHENDNVMISEDCLLFDYFQRVCGAKGRVVSYSDEKNKCYPSLTYQVVFSISGVVKRYDFCASDLILLKGEE